MITSWYEVILGHDRRIVSIQDIHWIMAGLKEYARESGKKIEHDTEDGVMVIKVM